MKAAGFVIGVLVLLGTAVAFIPFLGWMNWGVIPVAMVGLLLSIIGTVTGKRNRSTAIAGIVLNGLAILGGLMRLWIGGGIL